MFLSEASHAIDIKAEQMDVMHTNVNCKAVQVTEIEICSMVARIINEDNELKKHGRTSPDGRTIQRIFIK